LSTSALLCRSLVNVDSSDLTSHQENSGKRLKASSGTPSAGPVRPRGDQESRAAKVVTRFDFANWDGDLAGASHDPAPTVTTTTTQSETKQSSRKKLTPRVVARPARGVRPSQTGANSQPVTIVFRAREENGKWRTVHEVLVANQSDPSEVERVARKDARNQQATFYDKNLRKLTPAQCFEAAIEDETNMIFMQVGGELAMDEDTMKSIAAELEL
ncbi:hypothetical protein BJX76DRAFT_361131, partial [Aspergillus varians]